MKATKKEVEEDDRSRIDESMSDDMDEDDDHTIEYKEEEYEASIKELNNAVESTDDLRVKLKPSDEEEDKGGEAQDKISVDTVTRPMGVSVLVSAAITSQRPHILKKYDDTKAVIVPTDASVLEGFTETVSLDSQGLVMAEFCKEEEEK